MGGPNILIFLDRGELKIGGPVFCDSPQDRSKSNSGLYDHAAGNAFLPQTPQLHILLLGFPSNRVCPLLILQCVWELAECVYAVCLCAHAVLSVLPSVIK